MNSGTDFQATIADDILSQEGVQIIANLESNQNKAPNKGEHSKP
jgi:hypothetical protein